MTTSSPGRRANSKGKRGQTEAKNFLLSLGFVAVNAASHGVTGGRDVYCEDLPVWFEVKYGYSLDALDIHTKSLRDAWEQAASGAGVYYVKDSEGLAWPVTIGPTPVVLWKPPRRPWRMTWMDSCGLVTVTGADAIKAKLMEWKAGDEA